MINPFTIIAQTMQGINSMASQNPMAANALNMYRQGNTQGLTQLTQNIANSKGLKVDVTALAQQMSKGNFKDASSAQNALRKGLGL